MNCSNCNKNFIDRELIRSIHHFTYGLMSGPHQFYYKITCGENAVNYVCGVCLTALCRKACYDINLGK